MTRARQLADAGVKADYLDNVASDINTQLNAKAPLASPTFTGTIGGGAIGSAVTGFTGIKEADTWRVGTAFAGTAEPITSGWERDDSDLQGKIGTGMDHSSGAFYFPSTGYWYITFQSIFAIPSTVGPGRSLASRISAKPAGGSWNLAAYGMTQGEVYQNNQSYTTANCSIIVDITTSGSSGDMVRFEHTTTEANIDAHCDTNANETYAMFFRLGDT